MPRKATGRELLRILRERSVELHEKLEADPISLSFPTDGRGARIRVSVKKGMAAQIPSVLEVLLDGETVVVPLEVDEGYKKAEPLTHRYR